MTTLQHKRGDTFTRTFWLPTAIPDGYFAGWAVAAHMRTRGGMLIAELVCTWLDAPTCRAMTLSCADTTQWPVDPLEFDVQWTRPDGFAVSSASVQCRVTRDQTLIGGTP